MANENPLLNIPALTAPIADNVVVDFMGGASLQSQTFN